MKRYIRLKKAATCKFKTNIQLFANSLHSSSCCWLINILVYIFTKLGKKKLCKGTAKSRGRPNKEIFAVLDLSFAVLLLFVPLYVCMGDFYYHLQCGVVCYNVCMYGGGPLLSFVYIYVMIIEAPPYIQTIYERPLLSSAVRCCSEPERPLTALNYVTCLCFCWVYVCTHLC